MGRGARRVTSALTERREIAGWKLRATISGSFHRHLRHIQRSVDDCAHLGIEVLSPAVPYKVDAIGEFDFMESDPTRSIFLTEGRHLAAIRQSHFLWVVCPDGYTGVSTCFEIGCAVSAGVPVAAALAPADPDVAAYVDVVEDLPAAARLARDRVPWRPKRVDVLLDPKTAFARLDEARKIELGTATAAQILACAQTFALPGGEPLHQRPHEAALLRDSVR